MTHDDTREDLDLDLPQTPPERLLAHHRRQLSAMMDGELSPDQARFMLRRLQHDGELAGCWERWQVAGDVLRGRGHALLPADFSRRVAAAIAAPAEDATPAVAEAASGTVSRPKHHGLMRWGGGALAASVALVALFMARQLPDAQAPVLVEAAAAPQPAAMLAQSEQPAESAGTTTAGAAASLPAEGHAVDPAALVVVAAPVAVAVAELPRRSTERSNRSQMQRAAARRSQAAVAAEPTRLASATPAAAEAVQGRATEASSMLAAARASGAPGEALFGAPTATVPRPWPRAVLPGLGGGQPYAAGYGLPQAEAFAPFQPRLDRTGAPRSSGPSSPGAMPGAEATTPAGPVSPDTVPAG